MNNEFIKKWEKIFKDNKNEMFSAVILYNMNCNENYDNLSIEEKEKLLNFTYRFYMKDESCIDIGKIADTVMINYKDILAGKISRADLYNYINY